MLELAELVEPGEKSLYANAAERILRSLANYAT